MVSSSSQFLTSQPLLQSLNRPSSRESLVSSDLFKGSAQPTAATAGFQRLCLLSASTSHRVDHLDRFHPGRGQAFPPSTRPHALSPTGPRGAFLAKELQVCGCSSLGSCPSHPSGGQPCGGVEV